MALLRTDSLMAYDGLELPMDPGGLVGGIDTEPKIFVKGEE
jgi:hypothetical protein